MKPDASEQPPQLPLAQSARGQGPAEPGGGEVNLSRWLVSFASGPGWYPVGEFIAVDAAAAIDRAIAIFGVGSAYRAEEIPWDAGPLPRTNPAPARSAGRKEIPPGSAEAVGQNEGATEETRTKRG
jgi:hypothetical protein